MFSTPTYTLRVVEVAPQPHCHFGAGSICVVVFLVVVFPVLFLWFFFLHLRLDCDARGRRRWAGRAPFALLLLRLQWLCFDWGITGSGRHIFFDGNSLRQLVWRGQQGGRSESKGYLYTAGLEDGCAVLSKLKTGSYGGCDSFSTYFDALVASSELLLYGVTSDFSCVCVKSIWLPFFLMPLSLATSPSPIIFGPAP